MQKKHVRRWVAFQRDAVVLAAKTMAAVLSLVALAVGGSLASWIGGMPSSLAALVPLTGFVVFYAAGAYQVWDEADSRAEKAESAAAKDQAALAAAETPLAEARAKPTGTVHAPNMVKNYGTIDRSNVTTTYNAGQEAGHGPGEFNVCVPMVA